MNILRGKASRKFVDTKFKRCCSNKSFSAYIKLNNVKDIKKTLSLFAVQFKQVCEIDQIRYEKDISCVIITPKKCTDLLTLSQVDKVKVYGRYFQINFFIYDDYEKKPPGIKDEKKKELLRDDSEWIKQFINFNLKWKGNPRYAKYRINNELENLDQVINLETNWLNFTGYIDSIEKGLGKKLQTEFEIFGYEKQKNEVLDPDELEKNIEKNKEEKLRWIPLKREEQLQYAQMVRHLEDEYEMQWGEVTRNVKRWDENWPRYILPDGTALPNLDNMEAVNTWKERITNYKKEKDHEKKKNIIFSRILSEKFSLIKDNLKLVKLLLIKLGTKNQKIIDFDLKISSDHSFLLDLKRSSDELEVREGTQGSATLFFQQSKEFIEEASNENKKFTDDKISLEITDILQDMDLCLNKISKKFKDEEKNIEIEEPRYEEPRLEEETDPSSGYRLWPFVLNRQQKLFDAIQFNQKAVKEKINMEFKSAELDRETEKLVMPRNRVKSGVKEVDDHFDRLIEAINSLPISGEKRMEYFKKIPSTIGGPGSALKSMKLV